MSGAGAAMILQRLRAWVRPRREALALLGATPVPAKLERYLEAARYLVALEARVAALSRRTVALEAELAEVQRERDELRELQRAEGEARAVLDATIARAEAEGRRLVALPDDPQTTP